VLSLCSRGLLRAAVSQPVLLEAETNIRRKLAERALDRHFNQLANTPMIIAPVPPLPFRRQHWSHVNPKDDHVIAAAVEIGATYLLTLDRGFAIEVNIGATTILATTPGDFIVGELRLHPDLESLRESQ
jgi:hypothetical protein